MLVLMLGGTMSGVNKVQDSFGALNHDSMSFIHSRQCVVPDLSARWFLP
jgi:hypothetical protein